MALRERQASYRLSRSHRAGVDLREKVLRRAVGTCVAIGLLSFGAAQASLSWQSLAWVLPCRTGQVNAQVEHALTGQPSRHSMSAAAARGGSRAAGLTGLRAASTEDPGGIRVGVLNVPGAGDAFKAAFEARNVTEQTYFQTEVPDSTQMPLAAKFLAMSNTVDVIVAAHGSLASEDLLELRRGFQSVALSTNVPIVPCQGITDIDQSANTAKVMAEIRQQALFKGGSRGSVFYGIGAGNKTSTTEKKPKVYF